MGRSTWDQRFAVMANPPSETEQEKCDNAERMLRGAIDADSALSTHKLRIIRQGSFRNNTNVRQESDVDLALVCTESMYYDFAEGVPKQVFGVAAYGYDQFKAEVLSALQKKFGVAGVSVGKKSFDVHENSYRVDADITPFFDYKYYGNGYVADGIAFFTEGRRIINWPEQHYANGVAKNNETSRRYKQVVRIFKTIMYDLRDQGHEVASNVNGFSLECLAFNADSASFGADSLDDCVRNVIGDVFNKTNDPLVAATLVEVSKNKSLFGDKQKWSIEDMLAVLRLIYAYADYKQ